MDSLQILLLLLFWPLQIAENSETLDEKSLYLFFVVNEFSENQDYHINNYEIYPDNYSGNTIINIPATIIEEYIDDFFYTDSSRMRGLYYYPPKKLYL